MLSYSNLYSHPKKKLETHLLNVANISKDIFNNLSMKNKDFYAKLSFLIGISHDFAKSTTFFQDKLSFYQDKMHKSEYVKTEKSRHGFLSAVFGYYVVQNFLKKNPYNDLELDYASITFIIILKHHGNLSNIDREIRKIPKNYKIARKQIENIKTQDSLNFLKKFYSQYNINLEDFFERFESIREELEDKLDDLCYEEDFNIYINILLLYSVLLDSDKIDASETKIPNRIELDSDIVDLYKLNKFKSEKGINKIRNEAYDEIISNILNTDSENRIFSIDLPTGTGKTITVFSAALKLRDKIQKELNFSPRIIYSLPFLSIIDQNEKVLQDILDYFGYSGNDILLKHNFLSDMTYEVQNEDEIPLNNARILIEGWNSEIIITTFIQFFYSLISNKNKSIRKFHNMANSIIILDEIQSVPYNYWKLINLILKKIAYEFNSWIILMTATQPLIFSNDEIIPLVSNKEYYYENFNRFEYKFDLENISLDEFKTKIISEINKSDKNFMFVLNTIDSSKKLYDFIKEDFVNRDYDLIMDEENGIIYINEDIELIYLSTNIVPYHRLSRINHIKKSNKRKIIITTQLIEAGVDISVDIIYRDFAPLDSLIQTAGRCNRNGNGDKGIVNVISLTNDNNRVFSSFVYDSFLLDATQNIINNMNEFSENAFNNIAIQKYYNYLIEYGSNKNSRELINKIEMLNFDEIPSKFKLIDENIRKIDVFVEVNEESERLWEYFKEISSIENNFKRKNKFLSIKSKFYEYVISVDIKKFGSTILENEWLGHLYLDDLNRKYDFETGFKPIDDEEAFII